MQRKIIENLPIVIIILAASLICLYFSTYSTPIDADSGRTLHSSKLLLEEGPAEAFKTLEVFLPVVLYAGCLYLSPDFPLLLIQAVFSILTMVVVYKFVKRVTRDKLIQALSLSMFLASPLFFMRCSYISPYPMFTFLILLAVYLYDGFLLKGDKKLLVFAALSMGLAVYTHNLALMALPIPLLDFILRWLSGTKTSFRDILKFYVLLGIFTLPWFIWHFAVAGMHFYYCPYCWFTLKYTNLVNAEFWQQPQSLTWGYYDFWLDTIQQYLLPAYILLFSLIGLVRKANTRLVSWIIMFLIFLLFSGVATWDRYCYWVLLPLIILAAAGFNNLKKFLPKALLIIIASLVIILNISAIPSHLSECRDKQTRFEPVIQEISMFKEYIAPDETIYHRSHQFQQLLLQNNVLAFTDLSEEDALVFYGWQDEERVKDIMLKYGIDWVILYRDALRWERDYHQWFKYSTGEFPQHYIRINDSPYFERVAQGNFFILYRFSPSTGE